MPSSESNPESEFQRLVKLFREECERDEPPDPDAWLARNGGQNLTGLRERLVQIASTFKPQLPNALASILSDLDSNDPEDLLLGSTLGGYRIEELLGAGGFANVYKGIREDRIKQKVAIKVLRHREKEAVERFVREASIQVGLEHPNIASILNSGLTAEKYPFFVLEYIDGLPITKHSDRQALGINERLRLVQQVCAALDYAHNSHVVHRDLKPSNILVRKSGEVKLLDFGIAKVTNPILQNQLLTITRGSQPLTLQYASPEQLADKDVDERSDIYSVGILLYELVTGVSPFASGDQSLQHERTRDIIPILPSRTISESDASIASDRSTTAKELRRHLAGNIDNIVMMAIQPERDRRYRTAKELSDDIQSHLTNQPVKARNTPISYKFKKWILRKREAVAWSCVLLMGIIAIVSAVYFSNLTGTGDENRVEQASETQPSSQQLWSFDLSSDSAPLGGRLNTGDMLQFEEANLSKNLELALGLKESASKDWMLTIEFGDALRILYRPENSYDIAVRNHEGYFDVPHNVILVLQNQTVIRQFLVPARSEHFSRLSIGRTNEGELVFNPGPNSHFLMLPYFSTSEDDFVRIKSSCDVVFERLRLAVFEPASARATILSEGDCHFLRDEFVEAKQSYNKQLEQYRTSATGNENANATSDMFSECRTKLAICDVLLNQRRESSELKECANLTDPEHERWQILAKCQLALSAYKASEPGRSKQLVNELGSSKHVFLDQSILAELSARLTSDCRPSIMLDVQRLYGVPQQILNDRLAIQIRLTDIQRNLRGPFHYALHSSIAIHKAFLGQHEAAFDEMLALWEIIKNSNNYEAILFISMHLTRLGIVANQADLVERKLTEYMAKRAELDDGAISLQMPGLLIHRAILSSIANEQKSALEDLSRAIEFLEEFAKTPQNGWFCSAFIMEALLVKGFIFHQSGDEREALQAWRAGYHRVHQSDGIGNFSVRWLLATLSNDVKGGDLTKLDYGSIISNAITKTVLSDQTELEDLVYSFLVAFEDELQSAEEVALWRVPYAQHYRISARELVSEFVKASAFERAKPPNDTQIQIVDKFAEQVVGEYENGEISDQEVAIILIGAWFANRTFYWTEMSEPWKIFGRPAHAPFQYLLGFRLLRCGNRERAKECFVVCSQGEDPTLAEAARIALDELQRDQK